jgi:D-tyrosyl-tRNA(Tyr) deacylase
MRAVVQRVTEAKVEIEGRVTSRIGKGLVVLLGVAKSDTRIDAEYMADKIAGLRIFPDEAGKMNRDVKAAGGSLLVVSQFTLYGDVRRGRRPGFEEAAGPEEARVLYEYFLAALRGLDVPVETGTFRALMAVHLVNDGPVTIILDSGRTT